MQFHVITPFSRPENIPDLVEHLRPLGVIWHPLHHDPVSFPDEPWIQPQRIGYPQEWADAGAPCYWKVNEFFKGPIEWEDYYGILCDDDLLTEGFFDGIQTSKDVIVFSMRLPDGKILPAEPSAMSPSQVGFEQMYARGKVWMEHQYTCTHQADGELIERVYRDIPEQFEFFPEREVMFNALLPKVHLLFSMNADYREKGTPFMLSLQANCNIPVTLFNVDCGPIDWFAFNQIQVHSSSFRGYSHHARYMMQSGQFLDCFDCHKRDIILFTDADIILQRSFFDKELNWLKRLRNFSAGVNRVEGETLADEAPRLMLSDPVLLEYEYPDYQIKPIYNTGVVAAPRWVWETMFERYVERFPALFSCFGHYAAVQWLMCYCMGEVEPMHGNFHSHGHFGWPEGVTKEFDTVLYNGNVVALNHRI